MKTSNKILLGIFALGLLVFFILMVATRFNLQPQGFGQGDTLVDGSGTIEKDHRPLSNYNSLHLGHDFDIELIPDTSFIAFEADNNLLPLLETSIEEGKLKVRVKKDHSLFPSQRMKAIVGVPQTVRRLSFSGHTSVQSMDTLVIDTLTISTSGSGNVSFHCQSTHL